MMTDWLGFLAFVVALVFPFFVVTRWFGLGYVLSILFGWIVIHVANVTLPPPEGDEARTAAIFTGLWLYFGWVYMAIWSTFALGIVSVWIVAKRLLAGRLSGRESGNTREF